MKNRALLWVMIAALAAPLPLQGETSRPKPRPAGQITATATMIKPAPRPPVAQSVAAPVAPAVEAAKTAAAASSTAPDVRPKPRPVAAVAADAEVPKTAGMARSPRPLVRPKALVFAVAALRAAPQTGQADADPAKPNVLQLLFGAGNANKLPKDAEKLASAAPAPKTEVPTNQPRAGSVCGVRDIRGEKIKPIKSSVKGCGVSEAVRVTEVAGIRLSQAVTVECDTVIALKDWIDGALRPAFGRRDVTGLRIAAHYACRGRNNKRGARISEHGKGKALDISGFIFADGSEWSIARDYNKQIRTAHKGACGIFGTTLGPGSDGFHEDHLHFDTASYRSGPYCR
jgi:hypothetical protein